MIAIVREVSAAFDRALTMEALDRPIEVEKARAEHRGYVAALERAGAEVIVLAAENALPDACFVEDCAVVAGGVALIARPGAPSRRAEPPAVRDALARFLPVIEMPAPATLDGGDCLRIRDRLYVGRSSRTNAEGVAFARAVFEPRGVEVIEVPVAAGLHLKSACSPVGDLAVLVHDGALAPGTFPDEIGVSTAAEANVVVIGANVLVPAGFPEVARLVTQLGLTALPVDNAELRRADSALTCLSILVPAPRAAPT